MKQTAPLEEEEEEMDLRQSAQRAVFGAGEEGDFLAIPLVLETTPLLEGSWTMESGFRSNLGVEQIPSSSSSSSAVSLLSLRCFCCCCRSFLFVVVDLEFCCCCCC
jgi:hypothetical protein